MLNAYCFSNSYFIYEFIYFYYFLYLCVHVCGVIMLNQN